MVLSALGADLVLIQGSCTMNYPPFCQLLTEQCHRELGEVVRSITRRYDRNSLGLKYSEAIYPLRGNALCGMLSHSWSSVV